MDRLMICCEKKSIISICVAVSGGPDSMSLLMLAVKWARINSLFIYCVTVDHRLRSESAQEAEFVADFCKVLNITHKILPWNRNQDTISPGKLESLAREARYQLISEFCENNDVSILLIGHTWNDQLETFKMRKKAGSSASGLAGMSQIRSLTWRIKLLRPLLHFTKKHLEDFLKSQNITWKIDPMNDQSSFLRVLYRKRIMQYNDEEISSISNKIMLLGKRRNEIETAAVCFMKRFCAFSSCGSAIVEKGPLLTEEKVVQAEILKRMVWNIGMKRYARAINEDLCDQILSKKINTLGGCLLKIKKDKIFILKENRQNPSAHTWRLSHMGQNHKMMHEINGSNLFCLNKINMFDVFL
jgi:tRNA(Ile)-lysidine synthase